MGTASSQSEDSSIGAQPIRTVDATLYYFEGRGKADQVAFMNVSHLHVIRMLS